MTFDVSAISAIQAIPPAPAVVTPPRMVSAIVVSDEPVTVDTIPPAPPAEVLDELHTASQSYDALAATGRQVHFATDPRTGRVSIQMIDLATGTATKVSPSRVLDIAAGHITH